MAEERRAHPGDDGEHGGPAQRRSGLSVESSTAADIQVLTVAGEIDHDTGRQLREALDAARTAHPRVVVDLAEVTFMDSTGINILLTAHNALTGAGGWLRLAAPTGPVLRTLQLVAIDTVIECRPTLQAALA
ncbi:STAS domain-containing protein [Streptomyces sp. NPDC014006]|uniref:STAS domain-containing protein n=1 Tax=Streptomyces sp. NPDC014006 TaxID=3364870 RepID=UPI0036FE22CB